MTQSSEDLATLMRAANGGDAAAYRRLLERLASWLRGVVQRGLAHAGRGAEDSEDIVQEVLLAIHLKRQTWNQAQPVEPWVRAIAHYKMVDALRRRGFREHLPIEDVEELNALQVEPDAPARAEYVDLLATLSERQRAIVVGMAVEGRSAREIGAKLGMNEGAIRVALHRALRALAKAHQQGDT